MLKRLIKTISEFADSISKDHMGAFAAQSAFFILLSIFPIINIILGKEPDHIAQLLRADVNRDSEIVISDVNCVINMILK